MKVLFIGGTGNISAACSRSAVQKGIDLFLFNRGHRSFAIPEGARTIPGDIRDRPAAAQLLANRHFDVVVDWIAYEPEHVEADIDLFRGKTGQYIFISSASTYQKPPVHYLITESTPLGNPYWQYARSKIACEERLHRAYREEGFPMTIVRPSYTYGETRIPSAVSGANYTLLNRMKRGNKVIVHGDGQSLWTMTHNTDFAKGFDGFLGNEKAIGESFHITSDEVLTWDQIYNLIGAAAGVQPDLIHVPSELINAFDPKIGAGLLGDKSFSMVFDNSKIRRFVPGFQATVPFAEGVRKSVEWFEADEKRMIVDEELNRTMDGIIKAYQSAWPRCR